MPYKCCCTTLKTQQFKFAANLDESAHKVHCIGPISFEKCIKEWLSRTQIPHHVVLHRVSKNFSRCNRLCFCQTLTDFQMSLTDEWKGQRV